MESTSQPNRPGPHSPNTWSLGSFQRANISSLHGVCRHHLGRPPPGAFHQRDSPVGVERLERWKPVFMRVSEDEKPFPTRGQLERTPKSPGGPVNTAFQPQKLERSWCWKGTIGPPPGGGKSPRLCPSEVPSRLRTSSNPPGRYDQIFPPPLCLWESARFFCGPPR